MDDGDKECIICLSDKRDTIILPCKHMCLCVTCAMAIQNQTARKCPVCRDSNINNWNFLEEYFIDIESFIKLTMHAQAIVNMNSDINNNNDVFSASKNEQIGLNGGDNDDIDINFSID